MIDLITDSRKVKPGDTFIALRGVDRDGHDYIEASIKNGASKIIAEEGNYSVETLIVEDTRKYFEKYIYEKYYPMIKDIKLIGLTGTNGKTTTCFLIYQMLKKLNKKVAYIGTIGFYYNDTKRELNNTTPDIDILYNMLLECKENDIEYVVMEVSSHALDKNRIYGLEYDMVAFTNLTQDHLDYHKTLENYALAKQKLFKKLRNDKIAVINIDSDYHNYFLLEQNNNIKISSKEGDITILNIELSNLGTKLSFGYEHKNYETYINMVGRYNVYNYLTALIIIHKIGFEIEEILKLNENLTAPFGRMEMIKYNNNSIFVDYAHTPDAVENVLNSVLEYKKGKIITIIGCGGNRDKTKRPIMGNIASSKSDYVIFTNDNPRFENEKEIIEDILKGVLTDNYQVIYDRKEAIHQGIDMLDENDVLMILGKGHEDYQIIGDTKYHLSDKKIVIEYIK